jgi:hypothetical protein
MAEREDDPLEELTERQKRFVAEYLVDLNAKYAAIRAGFSPRSAKQQASLLLTEHAGVMAAVDAALAERSKRTGITQDYVLEKTRKMLEACTEKNPPDVRGAASLLALLAKHVGLGERPLAPTWNINLDYAALTDEQLEHLARGGSPDAMPKSQQPPTPASE